MYNTDLNYKYVLNITRKNFLGETEVFKAENLGEEEKVELDNDDDNEEVVYNKRDRSGLCYLAGILD